MFEDINNSGDGGVYAELVQNRAFQGSSIFPSTLNNWYSIGGAQLALKNLSSPLSQALPTSMQVNSGNGSEDVLGFWNEGMHRASCSWSKKRIDIVKAFGAFPFKLLGSTMDHFTSTVDSTEASRSHWCLIRLETRTRLPRLTLHRKAVHGLSSITPSIRRQMPQMGTTPFSSRCQLLQSKNL
jgi:hypothetical protein